MRRVTYYGWYDRRTKTFRLSKLPPDCPIRPALAFATYKEALAAMENRRHVDIMWLPPLHPDEMAYEGA